MSKNSDWYKPIGEGGGQMTNNIIDELLMAISRLVNEDKRSYVEKHQDIIIALSDDDRTNLAEFLSWFDDDEL
jgi:hypothetical protein